MRRLAVMVCALLMCAPTAWAAATTQAKLSYDTYAAGVPVMEMHVFMGIGPWNYRVDLDYHTTGLIGWLYRGTQVNTVRGMFRDDATDPLEFFGKGTWRGEQRLTLIDYNHGNPVVKQLEPPQQTERELVPRDMQLHTMDTLSALVQLIHNVALRQNCATSVRTYDGRRVLDVSATSAGQETLEPTSRSSFSGPALRCDFQGRELAGFLLGEDDPEHHRPLRGSAWLTPLHPGEVPLPVRIAFQTRWFGWATMYLTGAVNGAPE